MTQSMEVLNAPADKHVFKDTMNVRQRKCQSSKVKAPDNGKPLWQSKGMQQNGECIESI